MKNLISLLFICVNTLVFAQKGAIEMAGDTIKVNGVAYALLVKPHVLSPDLSVRSLSGADLFYLQHATYYESDRQKSYFRVLFFNDQRTCETEFYRVKKQVAKWIVQNDLIKDNAVHVKAEDRVILFSGTRYSDRD